MRNLCFSCYHHLLVLPETVCECSCLTLWFVLMLFCIKADRLAAIPAGMWDIRQLLCLLIVVLLLLFWPCSAACISSAGGHNA